jgi:hypothetical protein
LATGSILAIIFGIFLAFSLIATGYLFFNHRRRGPAKTAEAVTPFQDVEYESLGGPTPQVVHLQPNSHSSMQSSNFGSRAADTKPINSEVSNLNVSNPLVSKMLQKILVLSLICRPNPSPFPWIGNTDQI